MDCELLHRDIRIMTQKDKILNLLQQNEWTCTSQMYALYIADVRRRLCDLAQDGYELESRKCRQHDYHAGGSKEWRLIQKKSLGVPLPPQQNHQTRLFAGSFKYD